MSFLCSIKGFGLFGINIFLIAKVVLCYTVCDGAFGEEGWRPKTPGGKGFYGGDYSATECDTKTPGCEIGCINNLWPIGVRLKKNFILKIRGFLKYRLGKNLYNIVNL